MKTVPETHVEGTADRAAATLIGVGLATKATGFLRVAALTAAVGATRTGDAFFTAFLMPEVLYLWFTEGGLTGALVRVFEAHPGPRSRRALLVTMGVAALVLGLGVWVLAPPLVRLVAPGFGGDTQQQAVGYLKAAAPYLPLALGSFVLQAAWNARGRFLPPALGPLAFNLSMLGAAWWAATADDAGAVLALGLVVGGGAQLLCSLAAGRFPVQGEEVEDSLRPALMEATQVALPTVILVGLLQLQFLFERSLLSTSVVGSITRFSTAQKLVNLPLGLVAVPVLTALVPYLTARALADPEGEVRPGLRAGVDALVWLMVPLTGLLASMPLEAMALLFGRGRFGSGDLHLTAELVEVAAPATLALALSMLMVRGYLARGDGRTPALVKGAGTAAVIVLDVWAFPRYGPEALFLVAAVVHLAEALVLEALLPGGSPATALRTISPVLRALPPVAALVVAARTTVAAMVGPGGLAGLPGLVAGTIAGWAAFGAVGWMVGAPGPRRLRDELRRLRSS
jgi:putative peptidoglycan lipid II flippase